MDGRNIIGTFPDDTIGAAADVLAFLQAATDLDELGDRSRHGLFVILCAVEAALRYELAAQRPWATGGKP